MNESKTCTILIDAADTRYPERSRTFRTYRSEHLLHGSTIDLAVASHPHNDHIGSVRWVLDPCRVKAYIDNGQEYSTRLHANLMAAVRRQREQGPEYFAYGCVPVGRDAFCGDRGAAGARARPAGVRRLGVSHH
jgi:glyoxylase-like metal-dependent hydrolase (beta-lactamase superfamily II)